MKVITVFKSFSEVDNPSFVNLDDVLEAIRSGRCKAQVEEIRNAKTEEEVKSLKMRLPCVIYSGRFDIPITKERKGGGFIKSFRNDNSLSTHSKLVPFDVDDVDDVDRFKKDLIKDEHIYAIWKSPSGTGVHGLIKIADGNRHEEHYTAIIKKYPMFDTTARNPSRVLFMSYDPEILINKDSKTFFDIIEEEKHEGMPMTGSFTDYKRLDIAAKMIRLSETGSRHNAVIKASYLVGGYVAGGLVEETIAREVLRHEVFNKFQGEDIADEYRAIDDGIKQGQYMPINELSKYQYEIMEEAGLIEEELSFLSNNKEDEEYIRRYKAGLIPMGLPFGYEELDKYLLLKEGEFYALLGHSHVGKSTLNFWLIFLAALKYDWGWVLYTGENKIPSVKIKFIEFYVGKVIKDCSDEELQQALKWLNDRIFFVNNETMYSYESLLDYAQKVSKYHSIKGLFIDPINALKQGAKASKYEHEMEMYTQMLLFTKRTGISIVVSIHTRTDAQRTRDKDGNQLIPYPADADGGAVLYNKSDIFITVNRKIQDPQDWMFTEVYVNKQRNKDTGGNVTPRGQGVRLRLDYGIQFVDDYNRLGFERDYLKNIPKIIYQAPTDEDAMEEMLNIPF